MREVRDMHAWSGSFSFFFVFKSKIITKREVGLTAAENKNARSISFLKQIRETAFLFFELATLMRYLINISILPLPPMFRFWVYANRFCNLNDSLCISNQRRQAGTFRKYR